jgi:hypothetical protein
MNHKFDELTKSMAQSVTRRAALKKFGVSLAGVALLCLGLATGVEAQTSVTCDPAGDAVFGNGKGGPQVPAWLDIVTGTITDAGDSILFTMRVNAPIPTIPSWSLEDDFGQFWWSWRMVNDAASITFVSNGCLQSKGQNVPACYCLDLIWNIQAGSFRARLLDDTACTETAVPLAFSPDRREVILLVSKALFTNTALIPNANSFEYLIETFVWKSSSNGNTALTIVDNAPTQTGAGFRLGAWSSAGNTSFDCP